MFFSVELTQSFDEKEEGFVIVSMSLLCKRDFVIICKHSRPFNPGSMRVLHVDLGMYLRKYCKYTFTQVVQRAVIDIQVQNIIRRSWSYKVALIYCNNMSGLACCIGKENQFLSFLLKGNKDLLAFNIVQVWHMASPISRRSSFSWDRFWIWNLKINIGPKDQTKDFLKLSQT